jgi:hypothetical protein
MLGLSACQLQTNHHDIYGATEVPSSPCTMGRGGVGETCSAIGMCAVVVVSFVLDVQRVFILCTCRVRAHCTLDIY